MSFRVKINDKELDVSKGDTILKLLEKNGIYIPHICYNPYLGPIRTCDTCVVEVNGKFVRACETFVEENMDIRTNTDKVKVARQKAFNVILRNHNLYCTFCDNNVDCELHDAVSRLGIYSQHFIPKPYEIDDSNPFYVYDPKQCILCGRCVEACQDIVVNEVIKIDWKLNPPRVVWSNGKSIDYSSCVSCGTCVTVCPVNALMEKSILGEAGYFTGINSEVKEKLILAAKAGEKNFAPFMLISDIDKQMRNSMIKKTKTVCTFCGTGCSFEVWTKGRKILKVEPKPESPANGIATCIKGKFGLNFVNSKRLTKPLIREGNGFREATWDEAISLIAKKLTEIKEKYGPDSIGIIASCTSTNEEGYLAQKFARQVIGTNNVDNCARYCQSPATTGLIRTVGYGADSGSSDDLACADLIILIGTNTAEAHPVIAGKIKRAHKLYGKKLVVIDVRKHEMAERADIFITPKVGTDIVLINGIAKYIIDQGWEDKKFISERTVGFEKFKKSLEEFSLDYVERTTGISKDIIIKIAEMIHESKGVAIAWAMGITQHQDGSETSTAISNLLLLTGNYGKPCAGAFPLRGHANVQGVGDVGALYNFLPGYQSLNDEEVRRKFEEAWNCKLPKNPGIPSTEMVDAILEGKIHAMYIMGEDKVLADSDQAKTRESFSKLDFLVVQDMFMTETAKYAHVILPAAAFLEKEGTFTNTERRIQRLYKVMEPLGESKSDGEVLQMLANAMGYNWNYSHPSEIMKEIAKLAPIFAGVTYDRLEGFKSLLWPVKEDGTDSRYLYKDSFPFPDGKARFYPTTFIKPIETDEEYNLYLVNGRMLEQFHWMHMTGKTPGIMYKVPETFLEVSPELARKLELKDGDAVMIRSKSGKLKTKVMITNRVSGDRVFLSIHDSKDMNVNLVTLDNKDPTAKTPAYKETPVKIEKIESCSVCEPPLPKWNPRNAERTPQIGVKVEEKWQRKDYIKVIDQ